MNQRVLNSLKLKLKILKLKMRFSDKKKKKKTKDEILSLKDFGVLESRNLLILVKKR